MPIFKINGQIVYFAHIPKCGGTSIEMALIKAGAKIAMRDTSFGSHNYKQWYQSSPQHITRQDLLRFFDTNFIDLKLAVVRDPYDRYVSAFKDAIERGSIPSEQSPVSFAEKLADGFTNEDHYKFDNHFRPGHEIVLDGATMFKLERGLDKVEAWFKRLFAPALNHIQIRHVNRGKSTLEIDEEDRLRTLVKQIYKDDYRVFKY